jgi:hypothetical protein
MEQHNDIKKVDDGEFQFFKSRPSMWPRVIGYGILGLSAVILVAYSTFEIGSNARAFISDQTLRPVVLLVVVLAAIAGVFQLP